MATIASPSIMMGLVLLGLGVSSHSNFSLSRNNPDMWMLIHVGVATTVMNNVLVKQIIGV